MAVILSSRFWYLPPSKGVFSQTLIISCRASSPCVLPPRHSTLQSSWAAAKRAVDGALAEWMEKHEGMVLALGEGGEMRELVVAMNRFVCERVLQGVNA